MFLTIVLATTVSGLVSLIGSYLLSRKGVWKETFTLQLTAFASGVMLTTALLHLAPEALHEGLEAEQLFTTIFTGILAFFIFERLVLWFHHHHEHHGPKPSAWLITVGDSIHNFIDGVAIAGAFMTDPVLGIVTTLAVGLHEIPQEIADFVTMIRGGMPAPRVLQLNMLSACVSLLGAVLMYLVGGSVLTTIPWIIAFSAGMFLYIALSDLIPELHHHTKKNSEKWIQLLWLFAGIFLTFTVTSIVEGQLHHEDEETSTAIESGYHPDEDINDAYKAL